MCLISALYLRITEVNDKNFMKEFEKIEAEGEVDWSMNPKHIGNEFEERTFDGMKVYYVGSKKNYKNVLFYIHGGYYFHHAAKSHLLMLRNILNQSNTMVVFPVYPLTPFKTVDDCFDKMISLYNRVLEENIGKKIILSGDSAGGGFALALAEHIKNQPDELILLSPWVDVSMSNQKMWDYDKVDPMLSIEKARFMGKIWAGKNGPKDPRVSPLFGDLSKLKNVTIFVGTREVFYPDNITLYEKLKSINSPNMRLIVGEKQNHVYPAYPTPEAKKAQKQIVEIINR